MMGELDGFSDGIRPEGARESSFRRRILELRLLMDLFAYAYDPEPLSTYRELVDDAYERVDGRAVVGVDTAPGGDEHLCSAEVGDFAVADGGESRGERRGWRAKARAIQQRGGERQPVEPECLGDAERASRVRDEQVARPRGAFGGGDRIA